MREEKRMAFRAEQKQHAGLPQRRSIRPEGTIAAGFFVAIMLGTAMLSLPAAGRNGQSIGFGKALFTATSAICVTGLVAVDTGTSFSLFGQTILICLIQLGGLGFMLFAGIAMQMLGRRITLRSRLLMKESLNASSMSGLVRLSGWYILMTLVVEGVGACVLAVFFVPVFGWMRGMYYGLWHAISAFCNAGFDLFGGYASLTDFSHSTGVLCTTALLISIGGVGVFVVQDILMCRFRWSRFSLHTRVVLVMSSALLVAGTLLIACIEWDNPDTLGGFDRLDTKAVNALFQAVSMRTAGFNTIDLSAMKDSSKLVCVTQMFIGASSASTGGGVKTTTIAVLMIAVLSEIRGSDDLVAFRRRISPDLIRRAVAIVAVSLGLLLCATIILSILEGDQFSLTDLLFEAASALATVGVSSIGTPNLSAGGKMILIPLMYLGRVGPLTMALAFARRQTGKGCRIRCPEEDVTIG